MALFTLDGKEVKRHDDFDVRGWLEWMDKHRSDCLVAYTRILSVTVETRFDGCDMSGANCPFCTTVKGKTMYGGGRAATWQEAEKIHQRVCDLVEGEKTVEFRKIAHGERKKSILDVLKRK